MNGSNPAVLSKMRGIAVVFALVGVIGCIVGWVISPHEFFMSYLVGWLVWFGIAAGSLLWLMIHFLTGGKWGFPLRRSLEAAAGTFPLLALLFIPIFFGLRDLYPWMNPAIVAASDVLEKKRTYLNTPGFIIRTAVFFLIWTWIVHLLRKWSREQDSTHSIEPMKKLRTLSGPGIVLFPFMATIVYVDWIMSLEKDWYSTMFPILICIGQMLSALAFMIILLAWLAPRTSLRTITGTENFHHLGSLLLAFTMMWAYMAFGQLLIIWSGDLPHEISWYLHRISGGWRWVVNFIFLFHFLIPFFLLLSRKTKRNVATLTVVAAFILLAHIIDVWWLVTPTFYPADVHVSWIDFAAIIGVGGIWGTLFTMRLSAESLIPLNDPRFAVATT